MSGPKHLWSGNWEDDSARAAQERSVQPPPLFTEPDPVQEAPPEQPERPRRSSLRLALATAAALLIVVAAVLAVTLGGSSKPKHHARRGSVASTPSTTTAPGATGGAAVQSAPVTSGTGPTANWLGMQLVTVPGGVAINSLKLGSPADRAGFEPGDVIDEIDGRQISDVPGVVAATANIPLGHNVQIQVLRSSVFVMLSAVPLTERPAIHP